LAHPLGEQRLAEGVVDLVRAGVIEILAFEVDRVPGPLAQTGREVQRRGTSHVIAQQQIELRAEVRVCARCRPRVFELGQGGHQRVGRVVPAVLAEPVLDGAHRVPRSAVDRTASANAWSLSGSLWPGLDSTPLATSTANGWTIEIASATLPGFRPPDRI